MSEVKVGECYRDPTDGEVVRVYAIVGEGLPRALVNVVVPGAGYAVMRTVWLHGSQGLRHWEHVPDPTLPAEVIAVAVELPPVVVEGDFEWDL